MGKTVYFKAQKGCISAFQFAVFGLRKGFFWKKKPSDLGTLRAVYRGIK